jgi:hypothetical protein
VVELERAGEELGSVLEDARSILSSQTSAPTNNGVGGDGGEEEEGDEGVPSPRSAASSAQKHSVAQGRWLRAVAHVMQRLAAQRAAKQSAEAAEMRSEVGRTFAPFDVEYKRVCIHLICVYRMCLIDSPHFFRDRSPRCSKNWSC